MGIKQRGFTLIELMIVVAIIAILASVAVPNYIGSRVVANETAAVSTLRTLITAQSSVRSAGSIDLDGNGVGEYGYFSELAAGAPIRDGAGFFLAPAALPVGLGQLNANGEIQRSGYLFVIYLPDIAGAGVGEAAGMGNPALLDDTQCESLWTAYAWPVSRGTSGARAFFANQVGEILQTRNIVRNYSSTGNGPNPDAAYLPAFPGVITGTSAVGAVGNDGETWIVAPQ